jgi:hypothetical protein
VQGGEALLLLGGHRWHVCGVGELPEV